MTLTSELENVNTLWNVRDQGSHIIVSGNETKAEIIVGQNYETTLYDSTGAEKTTETVPTKDQLIRTLEEHIQ